MGVAVEPAFDAVFDAANAGETLGPRAVVNAVSNASIFLGAADALNRLNIFLLHPPARGLPALENICSRGIERLESPYFVVVTRLLKICEFAAKILS